MIISRSFMPVIAGLCLILLMAVAESLAADSDTSMKLAPLSDDEQNRCLAILRDGLKSDEFWPSMHAAEALTLAGRSDEVRAALRNRLAQQTDDQRRCGLARELVRAGQRDALVVLSQILNNENSQGRVHAAECFYKLNEGDQEPGLLQTMAQSENLQLRLMSAAALARVGSQPAGAVLRQALRSNDRLARNTACFVLARLGQPEDLVTLRERYANESDLLARANLINALACLGDSQGRKDLLDSLKSSEAGIRASAAEHVGHARGIEYRSRLVELLDDPALDVRIRAAQSLFALSMPPEDWRKP